MKSDYYTLMSVGFFVLIGLQFLLLFFFTILTR